MTDTGKNTDTANTDTANTDTVKVITNTGNYSLVTLTKMSGFKINSTFLLKYRTAVFWLRLV